MESTQKTEVSLPPQGSRTPSGRQGAVAVPGSSPSSSHDGLLAVCSAGAVGETASAMTQRMDSMEGKKDRPGPKSSKEGKEEKIRSRSASRTDGRRTGQKSRDGSASSAASVSSNRSAASSATEAGRKARRDAELAAKRTMDRDRSLRAKRDMDRNKSSNEMEQDSQEEEEKEKGSASGEASSGSKGSRGRGRPPSTKEYVGLAAAKERLVEAERKQLNLQKERELIALTSEELFNKMGLCLEDALEDARRNPTADLSNRARDLQRRVLHVAKVSGNLKGGLQKELKMAALFTSACIEVLRTRVEMGPETDEKVQIEGLRRELEEAKKANQEATKENERLKKELDKVKEAKEGKKRRRNNYVPVASSTSSEEDLLSTRKKKKQGSSSPRKSQSKNSGNPQRETWEDMEVEVTESVNLPIPSLQATENAISKGILPPREEWPPAIRPKIQGQIKILEDRDLSGHKIHIRKKPDPAGDELEKEKNATAAGLFEQLVPMMDKWVERRLGPLMPSTKTEQNKKKEGDTPSTKIAGNNLAKARRNEGVSVEKTPNKEGGKSGDQAAWSQVIGKKQKAAAKKQQRQEKKENRTASTVSSKKPEARRDAGSSNANSSKKMPGNTKPTRRRPPRTAAVTLSCPPGKYAEALSKAKEKINLEELGIKGLRPRKGVTGALVLEIPGADGANKAKQLRDRMQESLRDMEGVRVARPVKCVDLRIKDVLELTTEVEIREAIAAHGEGAEDDIRVGTPQRSLNGLYTVWARCPVALANKIMNQGRLQIGWFSARVEILAARPLSCFKCLELGHVQANCKSSVDRRDLCYRCGKPGHLAKFCEEPPNCPVCAQAGRPASHRVDAATCARSANVGRKKEEATRSAVRGGPPLLSRGAIPSLYDREESKEARNLWKWSSSHPPRNKENRGIQEGRILKESRHVHSPRKTSAAVTDESESCPPCTRAAASKHGGA